MNTDFSEQPAGIVEAYENLRSIMRVHSPMSHWEQMRNALDELGKNIYGSYQNRRWIMGIPEYGLGQLSALTPVLGSSNTICDEFVSKEQYALSHYVFW